MKKIFISIGLGTIAGAIDLIPMIVQNLKWDANLSALSMWIVVGFLISTTNIKINQILKGILIAFLVLLPNVFIIGWHKPFVLIPISVMTLILGGLLGFTIGKIQN